MFLSLFFCYHGSVDHLCLVCLSKDDDSAGLVDVTGLFPAAAAASIFVPAEAVSFYVALLQPADAERK